MSTISITKNCEWFPKQLSKLNLLFSDRQDFPALQSREKVVVVLGEAGTMKSRLGYAFLAGGFDNGIKDSASVLLTSEGFALSHLQAAFSDWNVATPPQSSDQIIVREIKPRFLSSSNFVYRLRVCIRYAKAQVLKHNLKVDPWKIRVVIDDWNSIVESHTTLKEDPQLLLATLSVLREEEVLGMIIGTQPGSPQHKPTLHRNHDISQIEGVRIHCWPVDFYGSRRIALASSNLRRGDGSSTIYEISPGTNTYDFCLQPSFDVYEDIEFGKAKRVDLHVKLYSGQHDGVAPEDLTAAYHSDVKALFSNLFPSDKAGNDVVSFESIEKYDAFKDFTQYFGQSQLPNTLIFQADEFWTENPTESIFSPIQPEWIENLKKDGLNFRADMLPQDESEAVRRIPLHRDIGLILADRQAWWQSRNLPLDTFLFPSMEIDDYSYPVGNDFFGSICANDNLDDEFFKELKKGFVRPSAENPDAKSADELLNIRVGDVWNSLCFEGEKFEMEEQGSKLLKGQNAKPLDPSAFAPSWAMFFHACKVVSNATGKTPFDIDLRTKETLNSLTLEIWFSELRNHVVHFYKDKAESLARLDQLMKESQDFPAFFTSKLNQNNVFECSLLVAASLMSDVLPGKYREDELKCGKPNSEAVAIRTWFAPGVLCQFERDGLSVLRLPGRFCTRGDWYLGIANRSRSKSLGKLAIEKLASKQMNRKRLEQGIGLPAIEDNNLDLVRSKMRIYDPIKGRYRPATLRQLRGFFPSRESNTSSCEQKLLPIFRSRLKKYSEKNTNFFDLIADLIRESPRPIDEFKAWRDLSNDPTTKQLCERIVEFRSYCQKHVPAKN